MTNEDIDKLFVASFGLSRNPPYPAFSFEKYQHEGFRAAMQSEHVKGLERDAKSEVCEWQYLAGSGKWLSCSKAFYDQLHEQGYPATDMRALAIRQRADQIERGER